mgnify:CR=1 FL=1
MPVHGCLCSGCSTHCLRRPKHSAKTIDQAWLGLAWLGLAWLGLAWLGAVSTSNCLFALLLATRRHAAAVAVAYARHGCGLRLALCLGDLAQLLTVERCKTQEAFA